MIARTDPVDALPLKPRTLGVLRRRGIRTVGKLQEAMEGPPWSRPRGKATVADIAAALSAQPISKPMWSDDEPLFSDCEKPQKWPFINDWEERRGFNYQQAIQFLAAIRQMIPDITDDQESAVWRYLWRSHTGPIGVDKLVAHGLLRDDVGRFSEDADDVYATIMRAYFTHQHHRQDRIVPNLPRSLV